MANYNHVVLAGTVDSLTYDDKKNISSFDLIIREQNKPVQFIYCEYGGLLHYGVDGQEVILHGSITALYIAVSEWEII